MKHSKEKTKRKALWIMLGIVFGVLVIAYGLTAYYFSTRFSFNTVIDNTDCSYKTTEEVEEIISEQVESHQILVEGRDDLRTIIVAKDVNLHYVPDGQIKAILEQQNPLLWFVPLFKAPPEEETNVSVAYDHSRFVTKMSLLDLYNEEKIRPPVDAYIEFVDTQYVIHPEDLGSTLIQSRTEKAITDAIMTLSTNVDLNATGCYEPPKVLANNPDLYDTLTLWNTYARFAVFYDFGGTIELLDASITMDWIDISENGTGTLNMDALEAWVRDFGKRHDTIGKTRTFTTALGEEATVEGGDYGWEVDEEAELEAILEAFINHTGLKRSPCYVKEAVMHAEPGKPDWGDTYLELDLTNQHMYYIEKGTVKFDADVVTGSPWGNRATPQGVYEILEKRSPAKLVGEIQTDGKPEYETWVTYWMRMTWAGHGFHDATWQSWFGGDRYTYNGSHGCINMSYSDAETLYFLIDEGIPVVSHY